MHKNTVDTLLFNYWRLKPCIYSFKVAFFKKLALQLEFHRITKFQSKFRMKLYKNLQMINQDYIRNFHISANQNIRKQSIQSTDDQRSAEKPNQTVLYESKKKYKTQMCKNFEENGFCRYGKKCRFAHGYSQLCGQNEAKNQCYRTKKCFSFWNNGTCLYGARCQFRHYQVSNETRNFLQICNWALQVTDQTIQQSRLNKILLNILPEKKKI